MRSVNDRKLKVWTHEASNGHHLLADLYRLLSDNPLRYLEGLVPKEILEDIEAGGSSMFADKKETPEAILNLAADLAVHQLIQTLLSGNDDNVRNFHHVMLSTRNEAEKRVVMEKIAAALKDNDKMLRLKQTFSGVCLIDASMYQRQVEFHVRRQIARQLQLPTIKGNELEGNDNWLITNIEKEMSRKKYLVLLVDGDTEEPLDPRKVGFPKDELAGAVVLITTESPKQANDELTMTIDLKIKTQDHVLPWKVFCQHVGKDLVHSSSAIQTIAEQIVMECGSRLLALVLVAKSLKNVEDVKLWELALDNFHCPHPSYDISWFNGQSKVMVNAFINFMWDGMCMTQKHCLTFCLFIPKIKDGKLDNELLNDWISSLLVDAGEAEHHLRDFVDRSILLQFQDAKCRYIQMPEDTYSILQSLNTHNPLFIKKNGSGLTEPPNWELWHNAVHIELANNKLCELPSSPQCMELKMLLLHGNADLTKIPPDLFFKMPLLCILDLSYTSVRELPNSFFEIEMLRELYLKGCECFMKLPPEIGKLKKIEKLDLDQTQIIHMPEEIQELTNLQSLTLCFYEYRGKKSMQYSCSTIIPPGVISKLKGLKLLKIDVNPDDERWYENVQVILPEVLGLEYLRTLSLYIPKLELLKLMPTRIFELDFKFIVGRHMQRIISGTPPTDEAKFKQSECSLKFVKGAGVLYEIKKLVRHTKALFLDRHITLKNLSELGIMNLEQLQVCILVECKEMQTIVDGRHSDSNKDILSRLLYLSVSYMKNLRSIWEGRVRSSYSFGMLKSLALHNCPKLTTIFTLDFLGNLSLLKVLIVKDCPKISTLISDRSSIPKEQIFLPKLKKVLLLHLHELISISNGFHIGPSLENIGVYECPKLQSLSKTELSSQNLKVIKGEIKWWDALKWREVDWGKASRPSMFNGIFHSIDKGTDVMTQLGAYEEEDFDDCSDDNIGGSMDEPPQPLSDKVLGGQKRNAYRRRKTTPTWIQEGEIFEDGYSWRKYGQKFILGAKFPRVYYRCTHKFDQGCQATKHMQRLQEDPPLYRTTYYGSHTCRNLLNPNTILNSKSPSDSSILLSFNNSLPTKQDCTFFSSIVKKECVEDNPSSSSQLIVDSFRPVTLPSTLESDCLKLDYIMEPDDIQEFDWDCMTDSVDLNDIDFFDF